jgi:hypothetical protein
LRQTYGFTSRIKLLETRKLLKGESWSLSKILMDLRVMEQELGTVGYFTAVYLTY